MHRFARSLFRAMATGGDRPTVKRRRVVTSFISNDQGAYLLVKRSDEVGSYQGYWGGVSGGIEKGDEDPYQRAVIEIQEEVGYCFTLSDASDLTFIRRGRPLLVDDGETRKFCIYPFLFCLSESGIQKTPRLNWENIDAQFFTRTEFEKVATVPLLKNTLDRVVLLEKSQTDALRRLEDDREHGAAQLCLMALDELEKGALRACSRFAADPDAAVEHVLNFAWHLACCRPSMAAVGNAVASSMAKFVNAKNCRKEGKYLCYGIETVESLFKDAMQAERDSMIAASSALLENAMKHVDASLQEKHSKKPAGNDGLNIMTISLSSSIDTFIKECIKKNKASHVYVCESRPLFEGVKSAIAWQALACEERGQAITVITEAQASVFIKEVVIVVCGADSLALHGFVNKVGSSMLALLCKQYDIPLLVLSDTLKCTAGSIKDILFVASTRTERTIEQEEKDKREVIDSWCQAGILPSYACSGIKLPDAMNLHVRNIYFEETPYNLCRCTIITEKGILNQESLKEIINSISEEYRTAFLGLEF